MIKDATYVTYTGNDGECYALVTGDHGDGKLDLIVFDESTASPEHFKDVPKGQPGEGATWH